MLFEFLTVLGILLALALYFVILKPYIVYKKYVKLLPSLGYKVLIHPFRPLGSHVRQMMSRDKQLYGDVAKSFKQLYPNFDVAVMNIHNESAIQLINPDLIKEFYQNNNQNNYIKADIVTSSFKMLFKHGILMKEGQQWKLRKKILSSVFTHEFLVHLLPQIHKITNSRFDQMQKKYTIMKDQKQVIQVDLHLIFQEIFSEVIVRLFFGSEPSQTLDGKNICEFINEVIASIVKEVRSPLFTLFGETVASQDLKKKLSSFKKLARNLINKRLKQIESDKQKPSQPRDIIEALVLSGQFSYKEHADNKSQQALTYDDLIGEFCTFFVAGMDTTSNSLAGLVYHISKQESDQIMQKVRVEVEIITNEQEEEFLTFKDIKKMNYTDMMQKQGLRMYAPVTGIFFRKAIKSHYLKDIPIPKGMTVVARNRPNFFKEEYFKDPFVFNPERWASPNPNLHPYAFLPFSSGARTCIGNTLSIMESKIVLSVLLKRYKKMKLENQNYRMISTFLYMPEKTKMTLEKNI